MDLLNALKLQTADLPSGFSVGSMEGFQANEAAVAGYDDPAGTLQLMQRTGRVGGYVQQIADAGSANGAGVSIEVWNDAAGAATYFEHYPHPESSTTYEPIDVPGLGEQVFAYRYESNGSSGYAVAWRRGRLVLGVGEMVRAGQSVDHVLELAKALDKKARSVQQ